ncbi:MAG: alpha-amylase/4-alpha-glucanotransferase domain-containing protein [Nitrospirota bacterium]
MKKIKFVFAIHNHQPVGNFDHIAEEAYHNAYLPLVEAVREVPWFKINLHFTGSLLEWMLKSHPDFIKTVASMVESGQAEVMGGGFYEPILALLPDEDKLGQIRKLSKFVEEHFGKRPRGIWLAERVWEPHLPAAISDAGIEYVVVDDFHFKMSGLRDNELTGYFITEEQGKTLKVFPGSERLRYTIPFKEPEETIQCFRDIPDAGFNTLAVMADDGEKFGCWPGTYKWVYEEGWLRRFIKALEVNAEWIEPSTFSEYIDSEGPRGRVYLPTCSYMEMGEWSLPAAAMLEYEDFLEELKLQPGYDIKRLFVKGGFFRNFLSKYPEANAMHKRMLQVSRKVNAVAGSSLNDEAFDDLWRGQCNDAYWHGVFGGLYLPHLRDSVYRHLIKAEIAAEKASGAEGRLTVEVADLDGDLADEVMITNGDIAVALDPGEGGIIYELDYRPISMNLLNTLSRRPEAYHRKLTDQYSAAHAGEGAATIHDKMGAKEEGLFKYLHYDWYRKASLIDHFLGGEMDFEAFRNSAHKEAGDFVKSAYSSAVEKKNGKVIVVLSRTGEVQGQQVMVRKTVTVRKDDSGLHADYVLRNEGNEELNTAFAVEFNFSLLAGNSPDRYFEVPGHSLKAGNFASAGELNNVQEVRMVDEWLNYVLTLSFSEKAALWRFPVETVSQSESGYERVFQGSSVVPVWRVTLQPGVDSPLSIKLNLARR